MFHRHLFQERKPDCEELADYLSQLGIQTLNKKYIKINLSVNMVVN